MTVRVVIPQPYCRPTERVRDKGHLIATFAVVASMALGVLLDRVKGSVWVALIFLGIAGVWVGMTILFERIDPWKSSAPPQTLTVMSEDDFNRRVAQVRRETGASIPDCRHALILADGEVPAAVKDLRSRGQS